MQINVRRWRRTRAARILFWGALSATAAGALLLGAGLHRAWASFPNIPPLLDPNTTSITPAPNGGLWVQVQDSYANETLTPPGYTVRYDGAPGYENVHHAGSIVWVPGTNGYWVITARGQIWARGGAPHLCSDNLAKCSGFSPGFGFEIVAAAATPTGKGFWAVGRDGAVWTAGDAQSYGDARGAVGFPGGPTGIAPIPSGRGYCISISDGGVYCRGEAKFYGSFGGKPPGGHQITGIANSYDASGQVNGYWLVGDDGGVFSFGGAPFFGSSGGAWHGVAGITSYPQPGQNNDNPQTAAYAYVDIRGEVWVCRASTRQCVKT